MKKILLIVYFLLTVYVNGQNTVDSTKNFLDKTEFKIGYAGNIFWNNGLNFGTEYVWKEYEKIKDKKRGQKTITHQLLLDGNLTLSNNFATKTEAALFTNYGLKWRRTNTRGKQISIGINPFGYYRSFLPETYKVEDGEVKKVFLPGRSYFAPALSIGLGKLREGKKITGRYFSINLMYRTPFNAGTVPSFFFKYGYRFKLKKNK